MSLPRALRIMVRDQGVKYDDVQSDRERVGLQFNALATSVEGRDDKRPITAQELEHEQTENSYCRQA